MVVVQAPHDHVSATILRVSTWDSSRDRVLDVDRCDADGDMDSVGCDSGSDSDGGVAAAGVVDEAGRSAGVSAGDAAGSRTRPRVGVRAGAGAGVGACAGAGAGAATGAATGTVAGATAGLDTCPDAAGVEALVTNCDAGDVTEAPLCARAVNGGLAWGKAGIGGRVGEVRGFLFLRSFDPRLRPVDGGVVCCCWTTAAAGVAAMAAPSPRALAGVVECSW